MNKKVTILSLLFLLLTGITLFAQNDVPDIEDGKGKLRGFVTDSLSGEPIAFANIFLKGTNRGAPTNTEGYYFIPTIPPGSYDIDISFIGYKKKTIRVKILARKTTSLDVELIPSTVQLEELSVVGEMEMRPNETDLGLQKITAREINMLPTGAEADIFRAIQNAPGVNTTGDVTSKYYVRGGGGDQNLILLNGAPIYNPFHALGIFSVIDPEMISVMEFYKGGFEPEYGGRLSSILNVNTRDGNKNEYKAKGQAGLLSGKVSFEGPIPYGSFIATARKSYQPSILKKYLNDQDAPFDFYDLSFKANYGNPNIDRDGKFVIHGFLSGDNVIYDDQFVEDFKVSNSIFGVTWHKVWSNPLFSEFNIAYSGYNAEVDPKKSNSKPRSNKVSDITANFDFTYLYGNKDELRFGVQNKVINTSLKLTNSYGNTHDYQLDGWELAIYSNYKFLRWDYIGLDIGVRAVLNGLSEKRPFLLEPRLKMTYRPVPYIALKAAFGRYSQEVVTVNNENEIISIFEPWIIVPSTVNSSQATHYIAGIKTFITDIFTVEIEGYYKTLNNLIELNDRKFSSKFRDYMNVNGYSYGAELLLKYQPRMFFFNASYTLSWAFKERNGEEYPPRYDTRHSLNLLCGVELKGGWQFTANWSLRSGMPFTPILGFYDRMDINTDPYFQFGNFVSSTRWADKNTGRLPYYHRLDLSASKSFHVGFAKFVVGASVLNVYNRKNIFYFDKDTGERINMIPVFPSAFIRIEI